MSEEPVFLDTVGLVALLNADDWLHDEASTLFEEFGLTHRPVVTTNLVLAELGNGLARTVARATAGAFVREILHEPSARVLFVNPPLFQKGLDRYLRHEDKHWGLVDCISFEVMAEEGIREVFSADHHFAQAGFTCLFAGPG